MARVDGPTLKDVRLGAMKGESKTFGTMKVLLVNVIAPCEFPSKFVYNGCCRLVGGRLCSRNVDKCTHDSSSDDPSSWIHMYRFDITLVDDSTTLTDLPLRVTLFDAAASLLALGAAELARLDPLTQFTYVESILAGDNLPFLHVTLRTKDFSVVCQSLVIHKPTARPSRTFTPRRSYVPVSQTHASFESPTADYRSSTVYHTPGTSFTPSRVDTATSSSASGSHARTITIDERALNDINSKMADLQNCVRILNVALSPSQATQGTPFIDLTKE